MADYRRIARQDAIQAGLNPDIFLRQINQESGFNPNARSGAGALGIAQFMPGTAKGYGINPMDPIQALAAAAKMDAGNLKQYGSYARMLSAYNSGRPDAYLDPKFANGQTTNYVRSILNGQNVPAGKPQPNAGSLAQTMMGGGGNPMAPTPDTSSLLPLIQMIMARNQQAQQPIAGFKPF